MELAKPFACGENRRFCILKRDTALVWKVRGTPEEQLAGEQKRRKISRTQKLPTGKPRYFKVLLTIPTSLPSVGTMEKSPSLAARHHSEWAQTLPRGVA